MDTKRLRQKILDLAIRGKLVSQDPNDEPASALLERIRDEKERLIKEGKTKRNKKPLKDTTHYVTDIPFEIPKNWVWVRLEDFVYAVTDGDHQPPPQSPTGVPFLVISDVNTGRIVFDKARFVDEQYYVSLPVIRKAEKGDILFTVTGSYGIVIPVETEDKFCFQRHIGLIKTFDCTQWLTLALQSDYVRSYCDKVATGTAQKTVSLGHLRNLFIPVPPVDEQMRIAKVVDNWISIIDQIMKDTSDLTSSIAIAKSKILNLAIRGKLVPQDPNDEPAVDLLKRINPQFKRGENTKCPDIIPDSWQWVMLSDISEDSADGPFGSNLKKEHYTTEKEVRIIQLSNIGEEGWRDENVKYTTIQHLETISRSEVHAGDIVIAKMMPAGRAILCPNNDKKYVLSSDAVKFQLLREIDNRYILYAINSSVFRKQVYENVQGVTRVRTSLQKLRKYQIPLPPISEQHRIASKIDNLFAILDEINESLEA